jgi:acetyltransferase-like isoleucine patch superfamily enzyme
MEEMSERFKNWKQPEFDERGMTRWNWMCQHPENLSLEKYVDIGAFCYINAKNGVVIEEEAQVGSHCSIYSISTIDGKEGKVVIKKDARIGSHCTIMPGVTIGKGAIIGAHSYVNMDIPDNAVAYGVPAKVVKGGD